MIIVDMLNPYEHEDAEPLIESVRAIMPATAELIAQARSSESMLVYVNDNYEDWTAGRDELVKRALAGAEPDLVHPIVPPPDTPFVVKARHSIFYQTQLEYMLRQSGISKLILAGQVTEQCILYSALDGYVRHFEIAVASDCVAHIHEDLAQAALRMMELNMRARVLDGTRALGE